MNSILENAESLLTACYNYKYFWHIVTVIAMVVGIYIVAYYSGSTSGDRRKIRDRELADKKKRRILTDDIFDKNR